MRGRGGASGAEAGRYLREKNSRGCGGHLEVVGRWRGLRRVAVSDGGRKMRSDSVGSTPKINEFCASGFTVATKNQRGSRLGLRGGLTELDSYTSSTGSGWRGVIDDGL
jgi:hypothetical protein